METTKITPPATSNAGARFYDTDHVMAIFGYSKKTAFWNFVHRSNMPHVKFGPRKTLFPCAAIDAWIQHRTIGGGM